MDQLTLERRTPSGDLWQQTFIIVKTGKYGFDLQKPNGKKTYAAIRNRDERNWVTVLDGKGGKVFQGMISA